MAPVIWPHVLASFAIQLAIGAGEVDVANLGNLAGLRVAVHATAVDGLGLLVDELFVVHVAFSEVVIVVEMHADVLEVVAAAGSSMSARALTIEVSAEDGVHRTIVHVLSPLVYVILFVALVAFHVGQLWEEATLKMGLVLFAVEVFKILVTFVVYL